ncbi:MAG: cupredoxin family copper-binding protein [Steroidobacteraceae bacterium]
MRSSRRYWSKYVPLSSRIWSTRSNYRRPYPKVADATSVPKTYRIAIDNMAFKPQLLSVRRGDRVTWVNRDLFAHTVTQGGGLFDSKELKPGASWTWTAGAPGTFPYVCAFHPTMHAKLVVR